MKHIKHVWFIAQKDLRLFATDRLAMAFFLLFPFLFIVMFNFILKDAGAEDKRIELHMLTQESEGSLSYQIINSLETKDASQLEPGAPIIVWEKRDYESARLTVEDGELKGFVAFPSDFTERVFNGESTRLEVVADPDEDYTRAALNGLATTIANRIASTQVATATAIDLLSEQGASHAQIQQAIERIFAGANAADGEGEPFISVAVEQVGEVEGQNAADFMLPGYLVMFVFFGAALGAEAIVRERQNNTLERLFAASVKREAILGGIFAGTAIKGLIQIAIFWGVGILAFKVDMGQSPVAVILISLLMAIASAAFAIMLATLAKTERSASAVAVLTSLVLAALGGCWWPLFITPEWMQFLAKLTPHGWANDGLNKLMLFGAGFGDVLPQMLALVGFTVAFGIIGIWRFRTS